jgi:hypothetical protein
MDIEKLYENGVLYGTYTQFTRNGNNLENLNLPLIDIDRRIADLEQRVFANDKKVQTDLSQQILLLHHLGIIQVFRQLNISSRKISKLLSLTLNAHVDNVKKVMTALELPGSNIKTKKNYKFLVETFSSLRMEAEKEACEKILNEIIMKEAEKSKNK